MAAIPNIRGQAAYTYDNRSFFSGNTHPHFDATNPDTNFGVQTIVDQDTNINDYSGGSRANSRDVQHPYVNQSYYYNYLPLGWQQADTRPLHFKVSARDIAKSDSVLRREQYRSEIAQIRSAELERAPISSVASSRLLSSNFEGAGQPQMMLSDVFAPGYKV